MYNAYVFKYISGYYKKDNKKWTTLYSQTNIIDYKWSGISVLLNFWSDAKVQLENSSVLQGLFETEYLKQQIILKWNDEQNLIWRVSVRKQGTVKVNLFASVREELEIGKICFLLKAPGDAKRSKHLQ